MSTNNPDLKELLSEVSQRQIEQVKTLATVAANQNNMESRLKELIYDAKRIEENVIGFTAKYEENVKLIKGLSEKVKDNEKILEVIRSSHFRLKSQFDTFVATQKTIKDTKKEQGEEVKDWWKGIKDNIGWIILTIAGLLTLLWNIIYGEAKPPS